MLSLQNSKKLSGSDNHPRWSPTRLQPGRVFQTGPSIRLKDTYPRLLTAHPRRYSRTYGNYLTTVRSSPPAFPPFHSSSKYLSSSPFSEAYPEYRCQLSSAGGASSVRGAYFSGITHKCCRRSYGGRGFGSFSKFRNNKRRARDVTRRAEERVYGEIAMQTVTRMCTPACYTCLRVPACAGNPLRPFHPLCLSFSRSSRHFSGTRFRNVTREPCSSQLRASPLLHIHRLHPTSLCLTITGVSRTTSSLAVN